MSRYPDWVNQYKKKGTVIKKVGESYYLYSNTSKYVKGKKYPQPVQHFIGVVTREGVVESHKQKVSLTDIEVFEYGFSAALLQLCPDKWKANLKGDWHDVLCAIILRNSPNSYLLHQKIVNNENVCHHNLKLQETRLEESLGFELEELSLLKQVYVLNIDGKTVISKIQEEQRSLLDRLSISFGCEGG